MERKEGRSDEEREEKLGRGEEPGKRGMERKYLNVKTGMMEGRNRKRTK